MVSVNISYSDKLALVLRWVLSSFLASTFLALYNLVFALCYLGYMFLALLNIEHERCHFPSVKGSLHKP